MISKKEKDLLDFVYGQAENLKEFMRRNGYGEEYERVSYSVTLGYEWSNGIKADFTSAGFTVGKYIKERIYSPYRDTAWYEETERKGETG